jgi:polysaccharide export outer membrane protein
MAEACPGGVTTDGFWPSHPLAWTVLFHARRMIRAFFRCTAPVSLVALLATPATPALMRAAQAPPPPASSSTSTGYHLGAGDVLEIIVFNEAELSRKYTVRPDGAFEFPLVGGVQAAGMTPRDIEDHLREKLADGFVNNPQVTVKVLEYNSQHVYVIGEVAVPGPVPLTGRLTLLEAVSRAGGLSRNAGNDITVLRLEHPETGIGPVLPGQKGVKEIARVALDDLQKSTAVDNVSLNDGDTVFVAKGGVVVVTGEVITPGPVPHTHNLTVMQAIAMAGGTTKSGSEKRARIIRIVDGQKVEVKAKLTDLLTPGDIVRVSSRLF